MSFWLGAILNTQVVLLIDRMIFDQSRKMYVVLHPFWSNIKLKTKFSILNSQCFFLPGGCQGATDILFEILKNRFRDEPFPIESLMGFESEFREKIIPIWDSIKIEYEKACHEFGYGVSGVDCLLGGVDRSGKSFLVNICDVHNFEFRIWESPASWFSLTQSSEVNTMIGNKMRGFLETAMPMDELEQRRISKKLLSQLLFGVQRTNKFISPQHHLIFISVTDTEIWSKTYLPGCYRRWKVK